MPEDLSTLWSDVVTIPDFPAPGVSFKDLSGILANPIACLPREATVVAGQARGAGTAFPRRR